MICTMYIPWFGELPFYSRTFLNSCAMSKDILWIVHSDQAVPFSLSDNIRWFTCDNVSERVCRVFDESFVPERKWLHKLCDLKPFWHIIFDEKIEETEYRGWCDWDVVHNLSNLKFNFHSAKFTVGSMSSPLFITKNNCALEWFPTYPKNFLGCKLSVAWDELYYLYFVDSKIIQHGMTPEVDLKTKVDFAVHMYKAKHRKELYIKWIKQYCNFEVNYEI